MSRVGPSRRCLLASLAFLSLSGYLLAGLAPGVGCPNDNPFIVIMKKDGVQLYDTPKQVPNVCGDEFATYGTCCDVEGAIRYATNDTLKIQTASSRLADEYALFSGVTNQLIDKLILVASSPPIDKTTSETDKKINSAIKNANDLLEGSLLFDYLKDFATKPAIRTHEFLSLSKTCWDKLAQIRTDSICSTCSGRSDHYFKDSKVLISSQVCQGISDLCLKPLEMVIEFIEALEDLPKLLQESTRSGLDINWSQKLNAKEVKKYFDAFHESEVKAILQSVKAKKGVSDCKKEKVLVCHSVLRISKPIIIEHMQKMFNQTAPWEILLDNQIAKHVKINRIQISATADKKRADLKERLRKKGILSNWDIGQRRMLQFGLMMKNSMEVLGADATIVDFSDPSYTSLGMEGKGPMREDIHLP